MASSRVCVQALWLDFQGVALQRAHTTRDGDAGRGLHHSGIWATRLWVVLGAVTTGRWAWRRRRPARAHYSIGRTTF